MAEDEPAQAPKSPKDARLRSLDERLDRAQAEGAERTGVTRRAPLKGQSQGMRILSVLFGYPAGSALIGWLVDQWLGTRMIMIVMLFVGFIAAIWEVWKISNQRPE